MYEAKVKFIKHRAAKSKVERTLFALMSQSLEGNYLTEAPGMDQVYYRTTYEINELLAGSAAKYAKDMKVERTYEPETVQVWTVATTTGERKLLCSYVANEPEARYIKGLNGCSCHPFESWKECNQFHNQKFSIGDAVKNRCNGKKGIIHELARQEGNYVVVKYGPLPKNNELEHAAMLMKINDSKSMKNKNLDFGKYKYNSHGVCENPDVILAHLGKKLSYSLLVSQYRAGWLIGYSLINLDNGLPEIDDCIAFKLPPEGVAGSDGPFYILYIINGDELVRNYYGKGSGSIRIFQPVFNFYTENNISLTNKNTMSKSTTDKTEKPVKKASALAKGIASLLEPIATEQPVHQVENIPLSQIYPSASNPRKTFDKEYIAELAKSMKPPIGLLQPITLRKLEQKGQTTIYEIAFGERRYQAAKLLGWETIPSMIRNIADDELLALQIIENLQREDVNPIDEAVAFKTLLKTENLEWLASRIHKTKKYIIDRLKLNELIPEAIDNVRSGILPIGHAVTISKLSFADQKVCLQKCIGHDYFGKATKDDYCKVPLEDLKDFIADSIMTDFDKVNFDPADPLLYEVAGPCTTCPKRTCNSNLLFDDITKEDKCTDAACFQQKITNHVAREKERAKEKFGSVISGEKGYSGMVKVQGVELKYSATPTKNAVPVVITKAERYNRNELGTTVYIDSKILEAQKATKEADKKLKSDSPQRSMTYEQRQIMELKEAWPHIEKIEAMTTPQTAIVKEFLRSELDDVSTSVFIAFAAINGFPGTKEVTDAEAVIALDDELEYSEHFQFKKAIIDHIIGNYTTDEVIMMIMLLNDVKHTEKEVDEDDEADTFGFTWKQMMDIIHPPKETIVKKIAKKSAAKK